MRLYRAEINPPTTFQLFEQVLLVFRHSHPLRLIYLYKNVPIFLNCCGNLSMLENVNVDLAKMRSLEQSGYENMCVEENMLSLLQAPRCCWGLV